jgi:hypothetical protein
MWNRLLAILALLLALLLPLWGSPSAAAQQDTDGLITFEDGNDAEVLRTQVAGLRFSTSTGGSWRYGDVRTGNYNAPYPEACPITGGPCAYAVSEYLFVWLNGGAGLGRVDVISGTMQLFSAGFSTGEPLRLTAYNANDQRVAEGAVAPNLRTGQLDRVTLQAPDIAYVLIQGVENRWLMDDLIVQLPTGESGGPQPGNPPPQRRNDPAQITVLQRASSPALIAAGSEITLTLTISNRGRGMATNATITMPIDSSRVVVREARFSQAGMWVSDLRDEALTIQSGPLGGKGDVVTATVWLSVRADAPEGGALSERLRFRWRDQQGGGAGQSNRLVLAVGQPAPPAVGNLSVRQVAGAVGVAGDLFLPGEPAALWYHQPDGQAVEIGRVIADVDGQIASQFSTAGLPTGSYTIVAQGLWSALSAQRAFVLP